MDLDKLFRQSKNANANKILAQKKKVGTDELLAQLNISENQINSLDTKLSVNVAFLGVFAGFVLTWGFYFFQNNFIPLVLYVLTIIAVLVGVVYALFGMKSTVKKISYGLWSFGDVANFERYHSFAKKKRVQSLEDYQENLLTHLYTSAKLGRYKLKLYKRSLTITIISVFSFASFVLISIFS